MIEILAILHLVQLTFEAVYFVSLIHVSFSQGLLVTDVVIHFGTNRR
jgi:hypothetical protein